MDITINKVVPKIPEDFKGSKMFTRYESKVRKFLEEYVKENVCNLSNSLEESLATITQRAIRLSFTGGSSYDKDRFPGFESLFLNKPTDIRIYYSFMKENGYNPAENAMKKLINQGLRDNTDMMDCFDPKHPYSEMDNQILEILFEHYDTDSTKSDAIDAIQNIIKNEIYNYAVARIKLDGLETTQLNILGLPETDFERMSILSNIIRTIGHFFAGIIICSYKTDLSSAARESYVKNAIDSVSEEIEKFQTEQAGTEEKIKELENNNIVLQNKISALEKINQELCDKNNTIADNYYVKEREYKKKIQLLENELKSLVKSVEEDLVSENASDADISNSDVSINNIDQITSGRYLFVYEQSKHSNMKRRILERFPNSTIATSSAQLTSGADPDAVVFITKCMSHGFYEGFKSKCNNQTMVYVNSINMDVAVKEIARVLSRKSITPTCG